MAERAHPDSSHVFYAKGRINAADGKSLEAISMYTKSIDLDPDYWWSYLERGTIYEKNEQYDILIIDTAGRLQTKINLMNELAKIKRALSKQLPTMSIATLLTIDGMLGQNSFEQAKLFKQSTDVNGIILTKMDGTGKGGIVFAIAQELSIPIVFLTAYADDRIVERAKNTEPFGYLLKPFRIEELRIAIEMAIFKHAAGMRLRETERRLEAFWSPKCHARGKIERKPSIGTRNSRNKRGN